MKKSATAKLITLLSFLFILSFLLISCEGNSETIVSGNGNNNNNNDPGKIKIEGRVIHDLSGSPLQSAAILISGLSNEISLVTDADGKFSTEVLVASEINITIIANKEGFISDTVKAILIPNKNLSLPAFQLKPVPGGTIASGDPVSIFLVSQSSSFIGVKESGAEETARIVFVVQDSSGIPIDLAHSIDVKFKFGARPGGGELLSPTVIKTNSSGQAAVNLTSGTKAGVVQLFAEVTLPTKTIVSIPVAISIHGGLPDQSHFSVGPAFFNFPGLDIHGLVDPISIVLGDKYANPVRPQTAVYFTTTGGIIDGSLLTDNQGRGSVDLISGNPEPSHPIFGPGFATITASTANELQQNITRETVVLFSGFPNITCNPTSFDIPNGGSQSFVYTVQDRNGNPMAAGTNITVSAEGEDVKVLGQVDVTLPDTQSKTWTQFGFTIVDENDSVNVEKPVVVTIGSDGPNGGTFLQFSGTKR